MCLIVYYSKKSVKSGYFGVIIYNWWRKARKIGIFANQMLISLEIHMNTLNTWDFRHKNSQFGCFYAEYTENSGHSTRLFRKIGKVALFSIVLTPNLTIWVENSEKSDFSVKQVQIFEYCFYEKLHVGTY